MPLIVLRHGRTEANAAGLLQGRLDLPLDEVGREQAAAAAAAIGPVDLVISSPLQRAVQTAEAFGRPVAIEPRWAELDYGELDGVAVRDVPAEMWQQWRTDPDFRPPGGETIGELDARVRSACEDLVDEAAALRVLVTTHVSPIKAALGWTVGTGWEIAWRCHVAQNAVMEIATASGRPSLHSFNDTSHLR